ncbi:MAG: DUF4357 domain-containing protein [Planctomycetota bacterium]
MLGRSANGRVEWKDEHGRSLKEIQRRPARSANGRTLEPVAFGQIWT